MLYQEALWIADQIKDIGHDLSPLLNAGSSTLNFRKNEQPFIHSEIIVPFEKNGGEIIHLDMKKDEGVDMAGDLMQEDFRREVKARKIKGVLCSNLLEQVENAQIVCDLLSEILQPKGYIILTTPRLYPYHSDPIDTMFRPTVEEVCAMFSTCNLVTGKILNIPNTSHFKTLIASPKSLLITIGRILLPFYKHESWKLMIEDIPNLFKNYQVTCVVLQKR